MLSLSALTRGDGSMFNNLEEFLRPLFRSGSPSLLLSWLYFTLPLSLSKLVNYGACAEVFFYSVIAGSNLSIKDSSLSFPIEVMERGICILRKPPSLSNIVLKSLGN